MESGAALTLSPRARGNTQTVSVRGSRWGQLVDPGQLQLMLLRRMPSNTWHGLIIRSLTLLRNTLSYHVMEEEEVELQGLPDILGITWLATLVALRGTCQREPSPFYSHTGACSRLSL